ncbi:MAG TPA: YebC/PmpR family DNA-binding transcriptional regulator [Verrucomicrobia bacterium]|nr:YebC/PmpR family DNA-binding transcriptional regulator [Verrucomicrobiota bacterium]
MSGHSKWATIKHKKGAADAKRGKIFSKLAKEIMVVARQGGGDAASNITLRTLVQKAKGVNMPNDNIERAIKKGIGETGAAAFEEITYEGYAGGGVALVVNVLTDNRNRAAAEIRHIFGKHGSSFAQQGAVTRAFERKGQILVDASAVTEERLMEVALDSGADDIELDGEQYEILTDPSAFADVCDALEAAGIPAASKEVTLLPTMWATVSDAPQARSILRFVAALEDNDDVQNVYTNMDMTDEVMEAVGEDA